MATVRYVDLANGNDGNSGSAANPLRTFAAALALLGSGENIINAAGICRVPVVVSGVQGLTIRPWANASPLQFRLDRPITTSWTATANGAFSTSIGTGQNVVGVVKGFETNVNRHGQHYGYLAPVANAAATSASGSWFYDTATGLLHVNVDGSNPGTDLMWCQGGANALTLSNCQDCVVDRFAGYNALDATPGFGYLFIGSGSRNIVRIDNIDGYGYHAAGFVAGGGLVNQDNTIEGCDRRLIAGGNVGVQSSTTLVHFQFDTNLAANARGRDLDIRLNHLLGLNQTPLRGDTNLIGLYSHAQTGNRFAGIVWENIRVFQDFDATGSRTIANAGDTALPATLTDPAAYDVIVKNCQGYGLARTDITASIAFEGCFLRFDRTGGLATDANRIAFDPRGNSTSKALLLSGCDIGANLDVASGSPTILRGWTNLRLTAVNSTMYDTGTGASGDRSIISSVNNTTEEFRFHKCVMGYPAAAAGLRRLVRSDTYAVGAGTRIFENCAYIRISGYSGQGSLFSEANWAANVDSGLLAVATNPFQNQALVGKPARASTLYTTTNRTSGIKASGIYGQPNAGRIGAWQFGQMPTQPFTGMPVRNDLPMMFVSVYGNTASTRNNNRGYPNEFFNDPYGWMKTNVEPILAMGIRHVCIAHWHGQNVVADNTSDSAYYTGNPEQDGVPMRARSGILRFVDENPGVQFSLYFSPYPRNLHTGSLVPRQRMFDMAGDDGFEADRELIAPWIRANLRIMIADAVGAAADENITDGTFNIATLHDGNRAKLAARGVTLWGETWPQEYSPLGYREGQASRGPWLHVGAVVEASETLINEESYIVNDDVPGPGYHYVARGSGITIAMVNTLRSRGLIVGTNGEQSDEVIRHIAAGTPTDEPALRGRDRSRRNQTSVVT